MHSALAGVLLLVVLLWFVWSMFWLRRMELRRQAQARYQNVQWEPEGFGATVTATVDGQQLRWRGFRGVLEQKTPGGWKRIEPA